ncbi:MAG: hypothetical protein PVS3B3_23050 [Ktedonobacteraceae bacterium]
MVHQRLCDGSSHESHSTNEKMLGGSVETDVSILFFDASYGSYGSYLLHVTQFATRSVSLRKTILCYTLLQAYKQALVTGVKAKRGRGI